jgi:hypothetical protein
MSIKVRFESACFHPFPEGPQLDDVQLAVELLESVRGITYIFVEGEPWMELPVDPIGLISWRDHQVDCLLTEQTWRFPLTMEDGDLLEMTSVLVSTTVAAHLE